MRILEEDGYLEFLRDENQEVNVKYKSKYAGRNKITSDFINDAKKIHGDKYDYSKVEYKKSSIKVIIICKEHGEFKQLPTNHLKCYGCYKCAGKNITTSDFINDAKKIHGDKYNYSKTDYKKSSINVIIICKKHGEFKQIPNSHLKGSGCPKCSGRNKTTSEFINEAKKIHGDKYNYSKTDYKKSKTKVIIICKKHGEFKQIPTDHLSGRGCPGCVGNKRFITSDFINDAKKIHGDKYNYSKTDYKNSKTKVIIICKKHGEFKQSPNNHLRDRGCPGCAGKNKTTSDFINESKDIHGDKYDYSKTDYRNSKTKVIIICKKHGEFKQLPTCHLSGKGCPGCVGVRFKTTSEFINDAKKVHGNKYDYSKTEYKKSRIKVIIICKKHGEFKQSPNSHLNGRGCSECAGNKCKMLGGNYARKLKI